MSETIFQAAALIVPMIIAIVFHEVAHGWVARALGDPTAAEMNRLSLNPLRHVDPIGTIVLPGFLALIKAPVIGWAKPVPVNKYRLRNPRYGMMAVAAAGPATNFVLAALGAVLLGLLAQHRGGAPGGSDLAAFAAANLVYFLQVNIFLALFNLLPIPPFDGSHIVEGLLPREGGA
jgi:Zn-dependent protease